MIRANGYKNGFPLSVSLTDGLKGDVRFDGEKNPELYKELHDLVFRGYPTYGTYIPDDLTDHTYIAGVLSEWFFDTWVKVEVDGETLELPEEDTSGEVVF